MLLQQSCYTKCFYDYFHSNNIIHVYGTVLGLMTGYICTLSIHRLVESVQNSGHAKLRGRVTASTASTATNARQHNSNQEQRHSLQFLPGVANNKLH